MGTKGEKHGTLRCCHRNARVFCLLPHGREEEFDRLRWKQVGIPLGQGFEPLRLLG